jgi:[acyl-carrier-protein] S-malonyltransferase
MAAVMGAGPDAVQALVAAERGDLWVANHNSPQQTVIAGSRTAVRAAAARAAEAGLRCTVLPVTAACHTPLMAPAAAPLRRALDLTQFTAGQIPVVANVDATARQGGPHWRELCTRQLTGPVHWTATLRVLSETLAATTFLDIGPGATLSALTRRNLPDAESLRFRAPAVQGA